MYRFGGRRVVSAAVVAAVLAGGLAAGVGSASAAGSALDDATGNSSDDGVGSVGDALATFTSPDVLLALARNPAVLVAGPLIILWVALADELGLECAGPAVVPGCSSSES